MKNFFFILIFFPVFCYAQDTIPQHWWLNGYITNMQSFMFQRWDGDWTSDNLLHNRLNLKWRNTANTLGMALELRNRFITGESVKTIPGYAEMLNIDDGVMNLSKKISAGKSYIFNSKIDRAYIDYTQEKLQVKIGRQRINWGQCFTWNPNDLFNAYSFFDFDYPERPGSDAARVQYYTSSTSSFDIAIKANNQQKITSAALFHFNKWKYDFQVLGGILNEEDYVVGTGWSGNLWNASFRGELSYFHPQKHAADTSGVLVVSFGSEYAFRNSFVLQFEVLYNQSNSSGISSFADYYSMNLSAKNLSISEFSLMLQGSIPITPLFTASLAGMYYPKLNGIFIGPSLTYSLADNIDFSFIAQSFAGELEKGPTTYFHLGFLRLKWNF